MFMFRKILLVSSAALLVVLALGISFAPGSSGKNTNNTPQYNDKDATKMSSVYDFTVKDIDGKEVSLKNYSGKVLLIVNVASRCGYTKQYTPLEALYEKYKDAGFEILAFPCNDFGAQEPGSNEEIKEFCSLTYKVTFPLFDKIKVLGEDKAPLYTWLTSNSETGTDDISWNFEKFLIGKDGKIIKRYKSRIDPMSDLVTSDIDAALSK